MTSTVPLANTPGNHFVGRAPELAALTTGLADVLHGSARIITLAGEPGIGKTRTAQQLAATAAAQGALVLWGRCHEDGGAPPLWPWIQVIRAYAAQADPDALRSDLGPGAPDIVEIIAELRRLFPDMETPPALDLEQARFRFYDSVTAFLQRAAGRQPLVVVLDDLHWADRPSLRLLEFLAPEITHSSVLIIATYRDSDLSRRHPLGQTMGRLARETSYRPFHLGGLPEPDVDAFLQDHIGMVPPRDMVEALHRRTNGNPLFIAEIVRLLRQEGALATGRLDRSYGPLLQRIPEGVRDVIGRRLDRFSEDCQRVLGVAAVVGQDFGVSLLEQLLPELDEGQIIDAIQVAVTSSLVEATPGPVRVYRFTHALVQETLRDELSTSQRIRLHARIAAELERSYGEEAHLHAAELAYHLGEAGIGDGDRLAIYSQLAGEHALAVHAYEDAILHFERALAARPGGSVDAEQAAILWGLGRAQVVVWPRERLPDAVAPLRRACDYYLAVGDWQTAAEVALLPFYPLWGVPSGQQELVRSVLAAVPESAEQAARLWSRRGRLQAIEDGDVHAAEVSLKQALAIAEQGGDAALTYRVLADVANATIASGADAEVCQYVRRALALSSRVDDPLAELSARYSGAQSTFTLGDLPGLAAFSEPMLALAERVRDRFWLASAHRTRVYSLWLRGELAAARTASDTTLAIAPDETRDVAIRVQLEFEAGNVEQGSAYLNRLLELMDPGTAGWGLEHYLLPQTLAVVARIADSRDHLPLAKRIARAMLAKKPGFSHEVSARIPLAVAAFMDHDDMSAHEQYTALYPARGQGYVFTTTCVDRLLALLAQTVGDHALARQHFDDALTHCTDRGLHLELAWTSYDAAKFLLDSSDAGERARGVTLARQSATLSHELGLAPLGDHVARLLQEAPASPPVVSVPSGKVPVAAAMPGGLSPREIEVLQLLAAGHTNAEIAQALIISLNTVARHVTHIFEKTGTTNRTEAAAYAHRHGLVRPSDITLP